MSSTANRVVKNTGFLYAKMGITMFISLYTTRLILNSLGAADFGIFNIVGGAIAMLGFLNAAMAGATQRFMSYSEGEGNKKKQKSIFNISILLHFFIALAAGIALLIAGYFFFNGILNIPADRIFAAKVVYGSLIVSTMFTVMSVPYDAVLNAHENMKYYAIIGIIESLLKLSVALIVVYYFLRQTDCLWRFDGMHTTDHADHNANILPQTLYGMHDCTQEILGQDDDERNDKLCRMELWQ